MLKQEQIKALYEGKTFTSKMGVTAVVVEYIDSRKVIIEFEDGSRKTVSKGNLDKGSFANPKAQKNKIEELMNTKFLTNNGKQLSIVEYHNNKNIVVEFEDGFRRVVTLTNLKKGTIKHPNDRTVFGVGYLGALNEPISKDEYSKRRHTTWSSMLRRCYSDDYKAKTPTYNEVSVCEEWHNFQNFKKWYDENYYEIDGERMELDKDILVKGNKVYSPQTCVFVPSKINTLFTGVRKADSSIPKGVCYSKKERKYKAKLGGNDKFLKSKYKRGFLGTFETVEEAFEAYKRAKEERMRCLAEIYKDNIPTVLYEALINYEERFDK